MSTYMSQFLKPRIVDINKISNTRTRLVLEPLERGFGHTLGNALRRILLSSMEGTAVVEAQIDGIVHEYSAIEGVQEDAFVLPRSPQPFDHAVVTPCTFAIHADLDLCICQHVDPSAAGKLAALVAVEDFRRAMFCDGLFQSLYAKVRIHAVGQTPSQHLTAVPVHDRDQIQEATPHRYVGNVRAPDLVGAINHHVAQQVWPDLMLGMFFAGIWLLVNRHQPHKSHQPSYTVPTTSMPIPLHVPGHLARSIPRRFQKLLVPSRQICFTNRLPGNG